MILIKGFGDFAKVEQLFPELNEEAMTQVETFEAAGFIVAIHNLPSHIKTPEDYAMLQLDKFAELYLPETKNLQ